MIGQISLKAASLLTKKGIINHQVSYQVGLRQCNQKWPQCRRKELSQALPLPQLLHSYSEIPSSPGKSAVDGEVAGPLRGLAGEAAGLQDLGARWVGPRTAARALTPPPPQDRQQPCPGGHSVSRDEGQERDTVLPWAWSQGWTG